MARHRFLFLAPGLRPGDECAAVEDEEYHHLVHVLRVRTGDSVWITSGDGCVAYGVVERCGHNRAIVRIRRSLADAPPPQPLALALALVERDRFVRAVEHCVALGCTRIIPLRSQRSRPVTNVSGLRERLARVALAAMKQSFRAHRAYIDEVQPIDGVVDAASAYGRFFVGEQRAPLLGAPTTQSTIVVVGPEAGFSPAELRTLRAAGAQPVSVSRARLRTGTAAVALVAALARSD